MSARLMAERQLTPIMLRWYRGEASPADVSMLKMAGLIKVTNKTYGHVAATAKGMRLADKALGIEPDEEASP